MEKTLKLRTLSQLSLAVIAALTTSANAQEAKTTAKFGTRLIDTFCPARQNDEICKTAGPDKPRCVNNRASLNMVPSSAVISAGTAIPDNSAKSSLSSLCNVNGTSPAVVGITRRPNCSATL